MTHHSLHAMDPDKVYLLEGDDVVSAIMLQLGVPSIFAAARTVPACFTLAAFDNHPTHWIVFFLWKGCDDQKDDGLLFEATPKSTTPRDAMVANLRKRSLDAGGTGAVSFGQLPKPDASN